MSGARGLDRSRLLERERELELIREAVDAAERGAGGVLVFEGHAGLGKTRLVNEAVRHGSERGLRVLAARAEYLEQHSDWALMIDLLGGELGRLAPSERKRLLSGAAARVAPLFGRSSSSSRASDQAIGDSAFSIVDGLYWLFAGLAEAKPLLIGVDDAHWADALSLRALSYLGNRAEEIPVAVVLARRLGEQAPGTEAMEQLAAAPTVRTRRLAALGRDAVTALVREELPGASDELCARCFSLTGGNPFFIRALTLAIATGDTVLGEAHDEDASLAPEAIARSVLIRVARLGHSAAALARAAAVLGDGCELRHAAALAQLDNAAAREAAAPLAAAEILRDEEPLAFVHPLVRAAVYGDLSAFTRASLHAKAARVLRDDGCPPDRIAAHLLAAPADGDASAVETLRSAAGAALSRGAPQTAVIYLDRALAEPPPAGRRAEVLLELAAAELKTGELPAAETHAAEGVELLADPDARARGLQLLGRLYMAGAKHRQAADAFDRALAELGGDESSELAKDLQAAFITVASLEAELRTEALARLGPIMQRTGERPSRGERALIAQLALQQTLAAGPVDEAAALVERAWGDGELLAIEGPDGATLNIVTGALSYADYFERCVEVCSAWVEAASRSGSRNAWETAGYCRSYPLLRMAQLTRVLADTAVLEEGAGPRVMVGGAAAAIRALASLEAGDLATAQRALKVMEAPEVAASIEYIWLLEARGRIKLARQDPRGALEDFLDCGRRMAAVSISNPGPVPWRTDASLALLALGDAERARELAGEELEIASRMGSSASSGRATHTLAQAHVGAEAIDLYRSAVETLLGSQAVLDTARALIDLGAALRRAGHRADSREPLREGHALAHRGGASVLAERARVELAASGARPRMMTRRGVDELTPSEERVARMAASGMSNREIAQALFVTVKAVEGHLSMTYRKLGLGSRRELRNALRPDA